MQPKRFSLNKSVLECNDGDFVHYGDYAKLRVSAETIAKAYQELRLKYNTLKEIAETAFGGEIEIRVGYSDGDKGRENG